MSNKVYEIITEKIIEQLEQGTVPWHKPWIGSGSPKNLVSKKEYRGINVFLLSCSKYGNPYWVSYKQAKQLGGTVKKGEKSTIVVFWKQIKVDDKDNEGKQKTIPLLRYYRVFNVEQCKGFENKVPELDIKQNFQPLEQCETVLDNMQNKPDIQFKEPRAYYHPNHDFVNMPNKESFETPEFYYSVFFHELSHSTGHKKRLDRKTIGDCAFGSEKYSKEELVAEMGAAYLCGTCGIENKTIDNSAAYIKSWLRKLKDDVKMVVLAAAAAQKASDYILNKELKY